MYRFGRSAIASVKSKGSAISKSQNGPVFDAYLTCFSSSVMEKTSIQSSVHTLSLVGREVAADSSQISKDVFRANGIFLRWPCVKGHIVSAQSPLRLMESHRANTLTQSSVRFFASKASEQPKQTSSESKKEISTVEDPFDAPTYNIPEKPVTFAEGASYSLIILAGLGVAAAAAYGVFKELIFEPKEYKIFNKALKRIQDDSQVRVRIGSPITGYGQESRNRAARQRIPNRVYTDEFGIEHVEVNFYIRGPHGAGKVFTEMFKDKEDKQWKFTYLIVEINSPSKAQLMLESYMPAAPTSAPA